MVLYVTFWHELWSYSLYFLYSVYTFPIGVSNKIHSPWLWDTEYNWDMHHQKISKFKTAASKVWATIVGSASTRALSLWRFQSWIFTNNVSVRVVNEAGPPAPVISCVNVIHTGNIPAWPPSTEPANLVGYYPTTVNCLVNIQVQSSFPAVITCRSILKLGAGCLGRGDLARKALHV